MSLHYGTVSYPPAKAVEGERVVARMVANCECGGLYRSRCTMQENAKSGRITVRIMREIRREKIMPETARERGSAERHWEREWQRDRKRQAKAREIDARPSVYVPLETAPQAPVYVPLASSAPETARAAIFTPSLTSDPNPTPKADPRANLEASGPIADRSARDRWNDEAEATRFLMEAKAPKIRYRVAPEA